MMKSKGMNGFMEILNYGNIDYWKLLDLPSVDEKHPVSNDVNLMMIKLAFVSRFAIVRTLIAKHDCQYDYQTLLDIVNAYANLSVPKRFYEYNCYRQGENAYSSSDEYYGYEDVFKTDLNADDQNIFVDFIGAQKDYCLNELTNCCLKTMPKETNINVLQALIVALDEIHATESKRNTKEENNNQRKLK